MTKSIWGLLLLLMASLTLASCSQESDADAEALLATVPATANGAVVVNIKSILEKSGCEVKDNQVKLSPELEKKVAEMQDSTARGVISGLLKGESGVTISWAVVFWDSYLCLTGRLDDPARFQAYVEKESGQQFREENGVNIIDGEVAFIGNQFWFGLQGLPAAADLARYPKLDKDQSVAGSDYASTLLSGSRDVLGMVKLASAINTQRNRTQLMLALNMLFDGANMVSFSADIQKEDLVYDITLLNAEGKPAKFLLPTDKIDTKVISSLDCTGAVFGAMALPSALTRKVVDLMKSFGGGLPASLTDPLLEIDGTSAFAAGQGPEATDMKAIISTKTRPSAQLTEMVGNMTGMVVAVDNNRLLLNRDVKPKGTLNAAEMAPLFKGAMMGVVVNGPASGINMIDINGDANEGMSTIMLVPEKNSLAIRGKVGMGKEGWIGFVNRL